MAHSVYAASLVLACLVLVVPGLAQTAAPLLPPAGLHYQYWPLQLVQFIGPELPYSTIVLYVDDRTKDPTYDVTLTERVSGKRTHYVNKPALVGEDKGKGDDAYLTRIQVDGPDAPAKAAQYLTRFNTEKGVPVLWQFVQLTDASDQGSGVSPIDAPMPIVMYREQGALAGEGTAVKIGAITSTADMWKEYAQPPYFIPYHGALSTGVHILSLAPTSSAWTTTQPVAVTKGVSWKLTAQSGASFTAHAEAMNGAAATISLVDEAKATSMTLDAQESASGWLVNHVRLGPAGARPEHTLSIEFSPALATGTQSKLEIIAGKKTRLATGVVDTGTAADGVTTEKWSLSTPDWAKGKTATATSSVQH